MGFIGKLFSNLFGFGYKVPEMPKVQPTAKEMLPQTTAKEPESAVLGAEGVRELNNKRRSTGRSTLTINRRNGLNM